MIQEYITAITLTPNSNHANVRQWGGYSIRENAATAAPAKVNFRHGAVGGQIRQVLELGADQSATIIFPEGEVIPMSNGTYVEVVSGTIEGVLYI